MKRVKPGSKAAVLAQAGMQRPITNPAKAVTAKRNVAIQAGVTGEAQSPS